MTSMWSGGAPLNPVLARELKERMRGRRAAVVLTLYLLLLSGILYLAYRGHAGAAIGDPFGQPLATEVARIGRSMFEWVLFFMLLLVLFLVPGLTSGAIAGERERQTLVPLQVTLLRPASILIGKIGASLAYVMLLLVATLPLLAVAYLIGGVTIGQVAGALGLVLATSVVLACITVACSTFLRRVQSATVLAYGLTLLLVMGTLLAYAAFGLLDRANPNDPPGIEGPPRALLVPNPLLAVADAVGQRADPDGFSVASPFTPLVELVHPNEEFFISGPLDEDFEVAVPTTVVVDGEEGFFPQPAIPPDVVIAQQRVRDEDGPVPFWVRSFGVLTFFSLLALFLATRRLRTPAPEER